MNGSIDPEQLGAEKAPEAEDEELLSEERAEVLDWLDRIIPVAIGAGGGAGTGRASDTERVSQLVVGVAEMARLHAHSEAARGAGDAEGERAALSKLARVFASRGYHLASAVHAARRALQLGEDDELRAELSLWLEGLGEPATAASTLRALVTTSPTARDAARLLVRIGRLLVRAGEYDAALEALSDAAKVWVGFAEPLELAGVLAAAMQRPEAASLLLEAAERHDSLGAKDKAFEARRRAFEIAPSHAPAARALVRVLEKSGRAAAADEILRLHASAVTAADASAIQGERLINAVQQGDLSVALQAVVDGSFEGQLDGPLAAAVDEVLERAGLHDAIALRLEMKAAASEGSARSKILLVLAKQYMGRLASPDRALEAWIEAFACDPENQEALQALRGHATTMRDPMPLAEALLRASSSAELSSTRENCLRELEAIAEERLADPSLALWAVERRAAQEAVDKARERLLPRVRLQDGALQSAREALREATGESRTEALRRIASILRGRPQSEEEYLEALCELVTQAEEERRWWIELERVSLRSNRIDLLTAQLRARLERGVPRVELARLRTLLSRLAVRAGDCVLALAEVRALMKELPGHRPAAIQAWVLASVVSDPAAKAEAIELIAPSLTARLRASLQSLAADLWLALGEAEDAQRLGELASRSDSVEPRVLAQQARLALAGTPVDVQLLEKACSTLLPGQRLLEAIAQAQERAGDRMLALSWTRRLYELCPWDHRLLDQLVVRATMTGKAEQLVEVINLATESCFSNAVLAPILDKGLRALAAFDPIQASTAAHKVLTAVGPRYDPIRLLILDIASSSHTPRLSIAVIERWLAAGAEASQHPALLMRLSQLYHDVGEADGEALSIVRGAVLGEQRGELLECLERSLAPTSADGVLARAHAKALLLDPTDNHQTSEAAQAWRLLGAALWDLAGDHPSAVAAWARAAELDEAGGAEKLACDLEAFAGEDEAHNQLREYAAALEDPRSSARLIVIASAIALRNNHAQSALELGLRALELDSSRTDALVLIERSSDQCNRPDAIDTAYGIAAKGALGCVGKRAAHHRAARELLRRARPDLAIAHAIAAFEADPINGAVLRLMLKLGERNDPTEVVQALSRIADTASDPEIRAQWLKHGAQLAAKSAQHQRTALEMALSAMITTPESDIAALLGEVLSVTLASQPEERDVLELRLQRLLKACAPKLEGPRGARVGIRMARLSIDPMASPALALSWIHLALQCSGDVDEYESLVDMAASLCAEPTEAVRLLDLVIERAQTRAGPVGSALLTFCSTLAYALDDGTRGAALVEVAQKLQAGADHEDPFADFGDSDRPAPAPAAVEQGVEAEAVPATPEPMPPDVVVPAAPEPEEEHPVEPAQPVASQLPLAPPAIQPLGPGLEPSFLVEALLTAADQLAAAQLEEPESPVAEQEIVVPHEVEPSEQTQEEPEIEAVLTAEDQIDLEPSPQPEATVSEEVVEPQPVPEPQVVAAELVSEPLAEAAELVSEPQVAASEVQPESPIAPEVVQEPEAVQEQTAEPQPEEPRTSAVEPAPSPSPEPQFEREDLLRRAWAFQARGEIQAAIELLENATVSDPERAPEYDVRLRELYGLAGRNTQLRVVLDRIAERSADPSLRLTLLAEAATLCEARGDIDGARARWLQVFSLDPLQADAWAFLERDAAEREDHERLVSLLTARTEAATTVEDYRAAVARKVLVLEEHLARSQEAIDELEDALAKHGDDEGLLRLLADLAEAHLGVVPAARCWSRLVRVCTDRATAVAMACKAANVFLGQGLDVEAREAIAPLLETRTAPVLEVLVALERRQGNLSALGNALEALAESSIESPSRRARWLIEAADASLISGNGQQSVDRATRAARLAPEDISVQMYSILVQYRVEGLGNLTQVRALRTRLDAIHDQIGTDDVPMHAFLSAEVAGVLYGADAALEVLAQRHAEVGLRPLIALGMAERLAAVGSVEHALPLFDIVLGTKDLGGVRTLGQVAFAAGRAALRAGAVERAGLYLGVIEAQPEAADLANRLKTDIERAVAAAKAALAAAPQPVEPPEPPAEVVQAAQTVRPPPVAPVPAPPASTAAPAVSDASQEQVSPPTADLVPRLTPAYGTARAEIEAAPPSMAYVPVSSSRTEQELFGELARGSIEAGEELARILEPIPARAHDLAAVRRRQVVLAPTDARLLELLRDAALADRNRPHAEAVEHVIASLCGKVPPSPPPMLQHEQPERVLAMLLRGVHTAPSEAFGHLWTHAPHVLSREAIPFDLESMEQVAFGSPSPVGKAFSAAIRVLGLGKASVYCHRSRGPLQLAIALTVPPSVVLTGEIEDTLELRYKLASILAATLPANVMLFGLSEKKIQTLLKAMIAAFAPPEVSRGAESSVVQLAGYLWHALPARVQRRMSEIFADPHAFSYEDIWARALQSTRRAGLFVVGDLGTALRDTLDDPGVREGVDLKARDYLVHICKASVSAVDLVRLATSAEYAEARWRTEGSERRGVWSQGPRHEGA